MEPRDDRQEKPPSQGGFIPGQSFVGSIPNDGRVSSPSVTSPQRTSSTTQPPPSAPPSMTNAEKTRSPVSQPLSGKAVLKVFCSKAEQTSYRTFQFDATTTVRDALQTIRKKYNIDSPDFGLFVEPKTDCKSIDKNERGLWLDENKLISDYVSTQLHFKSKTRPLKVACLDYDSTKTLMIDETCIVQNLIPAIAKRFGVLDPAEYSVQVRTGTDKDNKPIVQWVDTSKTLCEQGIFNQDLIFRKKFFVTDFYFDPVDSSTLHLIYLEAKHAVINSLFPCKFEQLVYFAALQMQITYGNYDPLVHVAGFLPLQDFLPATSADVQFVEEDIYKAHRRLKDLGKTDAQSRYVKLCFSFPTYGVTYVRAKEASAGSNSVDHEFLIGVNSDSLLSLQADTKAILARTSLTDIISYTAKGRIVTCQFNSGKSRKLILFADQDAQLLVDLIAGYISFRKSKRKETFAQKVFSRHSARSPPFPLARSALSPKIKIKGHSPFVNSRNESGGSTSSGGTGSGMFGAGKISSISQFPDGASYDSRLPEGKQDHAFLLNADRGDTSTFSPDDR